MPKQNLDIPIKPLDPPQNSQAEPQSVSKKKSSIIPLLITLIILGLIGFGGYKIYQIIQQASNIAPVEIKLNETNETKKIQSTIEYTKPVSVDEPTGRTNPLAPFQITVK